MPDYSDLLRRLQRTPSDWHNPEQELLNRAATAIEFQQGMIEQADRQIAEYRQRAEQAEADSAALRQQNINLDKATDELYRWLDAKEADNAALRDALQHIAEPLAWEQDHLEPGYKINGPMMMSMLDQPSYYREIARAALLAGK